MRRFTWFVLLFLLVSCGSAIEDTETVVDSGDSASEEADVIIEPDEDTPDEAYSEGTEGQAVIGALPSPNAPRKIGDLGVGEANGTAIGNRAPNSGTLLFLPFIMRDP